MRSKITLLLILSFFISSQILAQIPTQTIRGTAVDKDSKYPLIGVNVIIQTDDGATIGNVTDEDGLFTIENVPVGRQTVEFS